MIDISLFFICVSAFSTALCVIWTIRAANRIVDDYHRLRQLEEAYKRYLDSLLCRAHAILASYTDYQTAITVTNSVKEQEE